MNEIPGYNYGRVPRSPVSMDTFDQIKQTVGWSNADANALKRAAALLKGDEELLVDGWRSIIASLPHLAAVFKRPDGTPDEKYKAAVKKRFVQWVHDMLTCSFDQDWLDYQHEIGRRHTPVAKNATDGGDTPSVVPMRHLIAFLPATLFAVPDRIAAKGANPEEVDAIRRAWTRAIALTMTLWTRAYVDEALW